MGDAQRKGIDGMGLASSDHCIVDHCSISWSSDEGFNSRAARNITFQHCIISEALQHSYHYRGSDRTKFEQHAFAASISGDIGSFYHNLLAHCTDRNWSLADGYDSAGHYAGTRGPTFDPPGKNSAGIIDRQDDVKDANGSPDFLWPEYRTFDVPVDTDYEGSPDDWERRAGLNPNDPRDANATREDGGYTNLERYLGWLVGEFPDSKTPYSDRK